MISRCFDFHFPNDAEYLFHVLIGALYMFFGTIFSLKQILCFKIGLSLLLLNWKSSLHILDTCFFSNS